MWRRGSFLILLTAVACTTASAQTIRPVWLTTADDFAISAAYYPVVATDSVPAVVLLHDLGQTREEWTGFATQLQHKGIAALAVDLRGHGESTRKLTTQGPQRVDYRDFTPSDFEAMLLDANAAVDWLIAQPGIDAQRIGLVGSSLGANVALRYAAFNEDLAALLLLSPGMVYRGLRADDPMRKLGPIPLRLVVSRFDAFYFKSCTKLLEIRHERDATTTPSTNELTICSGSVHGTDMLKRVKNLSPQLIDWLGQSLRPSAAPAAPPAATAK